MVESDSSDSSEIVLPLSSRQNPVPEPVSGHRRTWLSQHFVPASGLSSSQSVPTAPVERNFDFETMWTELSKLHIQRHALALSSSKRSSQQYLGIGAAPEHDLELHPVPRGSVGQAFRAKEDFRPGLASFDDLLVSCRLLLFLFSLLLFAACSCLWLLQSSFWAFACLYFGCWLVSRRLVPVAASLLVFAM